ncbi:RNA-guided endonuclease InsQ/TnpB family protein [Peribacillus asahii]|uniref:Transposase, family protein n=1 Tax=Peribacillus asahii TaxID=228899 RepID=A0A3Q9RM89_9BACI|nr:RNA-guided endonuclease TnpB family protein [Peribacillus asahii]AZV42442.1 transposase, family protein [Peribacillus asahii]USK86734.1 transposase [Peribacillus asahii]
MEHRTQQILIKNGHRMFGYCQMMCQNSKNMQNTTNFYIRQVYTSLTQDKKLQPLQEEVLGNINQYFEAMNNNQLLAYEKNVVKEMAKEKQKEVKCNLFEKPCKEHPHVDYNFLDSLFKLMNQHDYRSLPVQSSQSAMKQVFDNWKSFFESNKDYKVHPEKYKGKPRIPGYCRAKEKEVKITNQDCVIKEGKYLKFPKTKERLNIGKLGCLDGKLQEVRIIPRYGHYVIELVMKTKNEVEITKKTEKLMSIDMGIDNLAAITTNTGMEPLIIKGTPVKSINQYYNKEKAHYLGILRQGMNPKEGQFTSKRLEKLHEKRFLMIKDYFHKASYHIEVLALQEKVDVIVIGQNKDWKKEMNMGKRNNQSFAHIPHSMFIEMIKYKAEQHGIKVLVVEESYTSKASFVDGDFIPTYEKGSNGKHHFNGKRIKRGLYKTKHGFLVNADVNGSANILKKTYLKLNETDDFNIEAVRVWNPKSIIA